MAYNSPHTGPEIDAAVQMLGQVQDARDATSGDLAEVKVLSTQVVENATQVASHAETVITKTVQVEQHATDVAQARAESVTASATAVDSRDEAVLAAEAARASRDSAGASEQAASQSQLAAGLSEQIVVEQAALTQELAPLIAADSVAAQSSALRAARSAQDAVAVVTGGTAALAPEPGKIPIATGEGKIDADWLGPEIARAADVEAIASAVGGLESQVAKLPGIEKIPQANDSGSLDVGWIPLEMRQGIQQVEFVVDADFPVNASLYARTKCAEVGFRDVHCDHLIAQYGYSFIYPQQLAIDQSTDELFVLKSVGEGSNNFAWIWVHELSTGAVKSVFTTGERWQESLVIRYVGSDRYLYTIGDGGAPIRWLMNTLPANYSAITVSDRYTNVAGYSIMAFDGSHWYVQDASGYLGKSRRNRFLVYDKDFTELQGRVSLGLSDVGTILTGYLDYFPKLQALTFHEGALYGGMGGAYSPVSDAALKDKPSKLAGVSAFLPTGEKVLSALSDPETFIGHMSQLTGYQNTLCENEGVTSAGGRLYTMWVTLAPNERVSDEYLGRGIVICQEFSKSESRVDFRTGACLSRYPLDVEKFGSTVHSSSGQLLNPLTRDALDTFPKICQMMQDIGLSRYAFYGTNQAIKDVNGLDVVLTSCLVEFVNSGGSTYIVNVSGFNNKKLSYAIGGAGTIQSGPYSHGEEIGSNANGWYVKHASGFMECFFTKSDGLVCATAAGAVFRSDASWSWTFPAEFVVGGPTPSVSGNPCYGTRWWGGTTGQPSRTLCNPVIYSATNDPQLRPLTLEAKGRWRL